MVAVGRELGAPVAAVGKASGEFAENSAGR
jgi:hypothetical protein